MKLLDKIFGRWELNDDSGTRRMKREPEYRVEVTEPSPGQLFISMVPAAAKTDADGSPIPEGKPSLGLMVEINNGFPCAHIYSDPLYGDSALTVFGTGERIGVRSDEQRLIGDWDKTPLNAADAAVRLYGETEFSAFVSYGYNPARWGVMRHTANGPEAVCDPCLSEEAAQAAVSLLEDAPEMAWADLVQHLTEAGHPVPSEKDAAPRPTLRG